MSRWTANVAAIQTATALLENSEPAGQQERRILAGWSGWGGLASIFEHQPDRVEALIPLVQRLAALAGESPEYGWQQTEASTTTAHYTHPRIASVMWQLAYAHGFRSGRVLEPGCGSGMFLALAPDAASPTGVEIDPCAAAIARLLNPSAVVRCENFAQSALNTGGFDLAIGNVPFADIVMYDPRHNKSRHTIHNHFILKSLHLLKPGGVAVLLTSRFTLDAAQSAARREMAAVAELATAIRLPSGAHTRMAGTEALTDILVFRRHPTQADADRYLEALPSWLASADMHLPGGTVPVNLFMQENPGQMLGEPSVAIGMYGGEQLHVTASTDASQIADRIRALAGLPAPELPAARESAPGPAAHPAALAIVEPEVLEPLDPAEMWEGELVIHGGQLLQVENGEPAHYPVPASTLKEMKPLLAMRDKARMLLQLEGQVTADLTQLANVRATLRADWQAYVKKYGPLNRYTLRRTGRQDPRTGEDRYARVIPKAIKVLLSDPSGALVLSLENFDEETQTAREAAILLQRIITPRQPVTAAETPHDALAVCLDQVGHVDLARIAALLGVDETAARSQLGDLVYYDPEQQQLVPATEYLSGNVRDKLDAAVAQLANMPELQANVDALTAVIPRPLGADEVHAQIGAVWISEAVHQQFLRELISSTWASVEHGIGNVWAVNAEESSMASISTWGTARMPAAKIYQRLLEQKTVEVYDVIDLGGGDTTRILNVDETAAAGEKAVAIAERFADWVWEDPERAAELLEVYNRLFNSIVLRDYSKDGQRLTLPGMSDALVPAEHQRTSIARMIGEPTVGLFHVVGAGKTLCLAAGVTELKRLGLIRKPAIVVPNHMLEQMTREFLQLYPHARVLAASTDDFKKEKRRQFIAKIATNDWDAVIITRSAFEKIPVDLEFQKEYLLHEIERIRLQIEVNTDTGKRRTHNQIQKMLKSREQRYQALLDRDVDEVVTFSQLGVDYLAVDESHAYKNLATESNIRDANIEGSKRAQDMHMKLEYLRSLGRQRVATFATATPIANSVTEAYVTQVYMRPDLLHAAGIFHFDQWAATFAEKVTAVEMAPTGGGNYRLKTRVAKFKNVPEMLRIWHVFADVKTADDLDLPRPKVAYQLDGEQRDGARTVVIPPSDEMREFLEVLLARAERLSTSKVDPSEDNMLMVTGDGRKAALDMRLIDPNACSRRCKLDHVADEIARIYHDTIDNEYLIPGTDTPSPTRGALQIVFCDLSTPTMDKWNAYDELHTLLAERGVPFDRVRYIHEAKNNIEKGRLFEACRNGKVNVIIGSTEKMGVGTNIQARAVALHHLDCPWRPADLEQQDGRAVRQGNQNPFVQIIRYVVEQSFDAYSWQTVERKAKFIAQVTHSKLNIREIDDISDSTLSFAEVKALASGDPLILEHATAMSELQRLQRSRRAWERNQGTLDYQAQSHKARIAASERELERTRQLLAALTLQEGQPLQWSIRGSDTIERHQAASLLKSFGESADVTADWRPIGTVAGVPLHGKSSRNHFSGNLQIHVRIDHLPSTEVFETFAALKHDPLALVREITRLIEALPSREPMLLQNMEASRAELQRIAQVRDEPFKNQDDLDRAYAEVERIDAAMKAAQAAREAERQSQPGTQEPPAQQAA